MPGVRSIAVKSIRTTIQYALWKEIGAGGPLGTLCTKFLLFIVGKFFLNQNDVEFDISIGMPLYFFRVFPIPPLKFIYIYLLDIRHYFYQIL